MHTRYFPGAMAKFVVAVCFSGIPGSADTLPASCGGVGAKSYTPPAVTIPAVVLNRGTVITVTNATVAINGDTSSVKALVANPGPDGISIQEAIMATNNDPGIWNIQFAPALKGSTIVVDPGGPGPKGLSFLTGGNVTINGDIDGDGKPDITLTSISGTATGFFVISGGNTLNGLALQGCGICVSIQRPSAKFNLPAATGTTFSNITISNLVMTNIQNEAIVLSPVTGEPGLSDSSPAVATRNTWDHILITGNTISGNVSGPLLGIDLGLGTTIGDTLQHTTVANNNILLPMPGAGGIAMNFGAGLGSTGNQALDTLIANNVISGPLPAFGIRLATGVGSASANLIDGVQIISNQVSVTGQNPSSSPHLLGINVLSGDAASDDGNPSLRPIQYSENNIARNIGILSNTLNLADGVGVEVQAACCGNGNNTIGNLSILGNTIAGNVQINGGASGGYFSRPSTGNTVSNVLIQANSIQNSTPLGNPNFTLDEAIGNAGIQVWAAWEEPGNSVNAISIANNDVNTPFIGIEIIGGLGISQGPGDFLYPADNNVVSAAQIFCNQVDQAPTLGVTPSSGIKGITVAAGAGELEASGNQVQVSVVDNLVAGVLGDASLFANLESGASGNTISITRISGPANGPAITGVANAESGAPLIAPNTWIAIAGTNLAADSRSWMLPDFANNQMPVALDGTSVKINGQSAFVFYISSTQINVLTPPILVSGPAQVQVTLSGVSSAPFMVSAQPISPSFFVIGGSPYVLATHADGSLIGPATLFPGASTPAKPGETIVAYANGFGLTSVAAVAGSVNQSGILNPLPTIQAGGIAANVRFAGLISPGLYQINFDIPSGLAAGDYSLVASVGGMFTQAGTLVTVQP